MLLIGYYTTFGRKLQIFIADAMPFLTESGFLIAKKLDNSVRRGYNVKLMEFTIA